MSGATVANLRRNLAAEMSLTYDAKRSNFLNLNGMSFMNHILLTWKVDFDR